jgi:hypothetical protein
MSIRVSGLVRVARNCHVLAIAFVTVAARKLNERRKIYRDAVPGTLIEAKEAIFDLVAKHGVARQGSGRMGRPGSHVGAPTR